MNNVVYGGSLFSRAKNVLYLNQCKSVSVIVFSALERMASFSQKELSLLVCFGLWLSLGSIWSSAPVSLGLWLPDRSFSWVCLISFIECVLFWCSVHQITLTCLSLISLSYLCVFVCERYKFTFQLLPIDRCKVFRVLSRSNLASQMASPIIGAIIADFYKSDNFTANLAITRLLTLSLGLIVTETAAAVIHPNKDVSSSPNDFCFCVSIFL